MTTHAVVMLRITNLESLTQYREKAAEALARHGGEVLQASPDPVVLEGAPVMPDMIAILRFPDRARAEAWKTDPELQSIHELRRGSGTSDIILM
ncbi:hypothetical protein GCM10007385_27280 [Tateyamaria omphalii]|uniref:DUF1330 domain-containing protein n=1 Tax=Tateyamaria omphalii TaxID=299262 RepID=UPI001677754E|nr:DUF1330 domain-containing protein [Tateyamaria omphalii]GGX57010.1 hypothetical protein GCM10007385_27280 [Tateyamaria omphalii]